MLYSNLGAHARYAAGDSAFQQDPTNLVNMPPEFDRHALEVDEEVHLTS
jgi:hypothetical protein